MACSGLLRRLFRVAPLLFALAAAACGPMPGPVLPAVKSTAPESTSATELVRRLRERRAAIRSFRALAEMEYRGPKDKLRVKEVIVVRRPDHLRIEMMSAFGVALLIATDGMHVFAYHRGEKTFFTGAATTENLSRFTRLNLRVKDIANLLVGLPPPRRIQGRALASFETATGLWRLAQVLEGGGSRNVWFNARFLAVRSEEFDPSGARLWKVEYSGYQMTDGIELPLRVVLEAPGEQARVALDYSSASVNAPLPDALFTLTQPPGAKDVDLDDITAQP